MQKGTPMPTLFLSILILVITGCSLVPEFQDNRKMQFNKPKIHLHLYSRFQSEPEKYIAAFTSKGYEVEVQHSELPGSEEKSFIIHSPSMLNPNHYLEVENILTILKEIGVLEINQYHYFVGKHSYTPNHVGVYLL
jgi:hypothetical protein